ncbi:MAG: hypothetical protein ACR2PW_01915 [Gammaproteobacteria bacterium]
MIVERCAPEDWSTDKRSWKASEADRIFGSFGRIIFGVDSSGSEVGQEAREVAPDAMHEVPSAFAGVEARHAGPLVNSAIDVPALLDFAETPD